MKTASVLNALSEFTSDICASQFARATQRMHAAKQQVEVAHAERRAALLTLREQGWTYQRIADVIGITPQAVEAILRTRKKGS
jgi:DNA-directed RNA polymerase specialized sigma24 family protein